MRIRISLARWMVALAVLGAIGPPAAGAKPRSAPVKVEYAVPPGMKSGDEVEVVLRFRAMADLQQLNVTVFADKDVVSETREAVFTDVARGTAPELPIRVRLTGLKWGALAVTYRTRTATGTSADSLNIIFGDTK